MANFPKLRHRVMISHHGVRRASNTPPEICILCTFAKFHFSSIFFQSSSTVLRSSHPSSRGENSFENSLDGGVWIVWRKLHKNSLETLRFLSHSQLHCSFIIALDVGEGQLQKLLIICRIFNSGRKFISKTPVLLSQHFRFHLSRRKLFQNSLQCAAMLALTHSIFAHIAMFAADFVFQSFDHSFNSIQCV